MGQLTTDGYLRDTVDEIKEEIRGLLRAAFGNGIPVGEGVDGDLEEFVSIGTDVVDKREQEMERLFSSRYVSTAIGESLEQAVRFGGISQLLAARTESDPNVPNRSVIDGTPSAVIPVGTRVEIVATNERFRTKAEVTIGGGGTIDVDVEQVADPEEFGGIVFLPGDSVSGGEVTIVDPVSGFADFTFGDIVLGRKDETDEALRVRHAQSQQTTEGSIVNAIIKNILTVSGVTDAFAIENPNDDPDNEGRPGHSFELVVTGGADQAVLDAIGGTKAFGINTVGTISGTYNDTNGNPHVAAFSRTVTTLIFVKVTLTKNALYPADGDTQVKNEIETFGNDVFGRATGGLIIWDRFFEAVFNVPGITNVLVEGSLTFGTETDTNLQLEFKQKALFSVANTTVISS